jgi:hypothetical protein
MNTKTLAEDRGIVCDSCQETITRDGCAKCRKVFSDGDIIYCEHHSQTDCIHYCKNCKEE